MNQNVDYKMLKLGTWAVTHTSPRSSVDPELEIGAFLIIIRRSGVLHTDELLAVAPDLDQAVRRKAVAGVVPSPGKIDVIKILQLAPVLGDIVARSEYTKCSHSPSLTGPRSAS